MKGLLQGKVALVTGGGSGIGRASSLAFAKEGAKVVISDVDVDGGEITMRRILEVGGEAIFLKADVCKAAEVETLIRKSVQTYHRLDCAHNNAGIVARSLVPTADSKEEEWDRVINTNLKGTFLCMKYEIAQMVKQGEGFIVNTASVHGLRGNQNNSAYCASKHGIIGLTKSAAIEYAHAGLRINAVCPSVIRTPMVEQFTLDNPEYEGKLISKHPMGRFGFPEEVAGAVVWLCSEAASFITGHALVVDGGRIAS